MSSMSTQILFIDSRVANIDSLLAQVDPSYEVVLLDSAEAGLTQIAKALEGRTGIEALHVLSHGGAGFLNLGQFSVDKLTLSESAQVLSSISSSLTANADLMIYGCDVAAGEAGRAFIDALAAATGADVAASVDPTGADFLGGDWVLEAQTGAIEANPLALDGFDGLLGRTATYNFSNASGGYNRPAILTANNVQFTTGGTLTINAFDVDYRSGGSGDELNLVEMSFNGGGSWYRLYNNFGDSYLRGFDNRGSTTVFTVPNFTNGYGFSPGGSLMIKINGVGGRGWVFNTTSTSLAVFANTKPTSTDNLVTFNEDNTFTFSSAAFPFSDADTASDGDRLSTVQITGLNLQGGSFTLNGAQVNVNQTIAASQLSGLKYTPPANFFTNPNPNPTFTFKVYDGFEWSAASYTMTLNVTSVNDRPALSNSVVLMPMQEDQASNPGVTLASKFGTYFSDVETANMPGVVVTGSAANPTTEGSWQYFAGNAWHDIVAATVSPTNGLALSASTLIRFNPVLNYNGNPGTLSLVATDGDFNLASYATGAPAYGVDTIAAAATAGLSAVTRTVGITVLPSNDPPVFNPSGTITAGMQDTYRADNAGTLVLSAGTDSSVSSNTLTGTVSATDPETAANQLVYSIRGGELTSGSLSSGVWQLQGIYGLLTFSTTSATKTWVYTPNRFEAINALPAGASVNDTFDLKVVDTDGAAATRGLNITITGTNDVPRLNAQIADQSFNNSGNWSFQVPANSFVDAEGLGLTYSATLESGAALPAWLSFDPAPALSAAMPLLPPTAPH